MARIAYADSATPETQELAERIVAERGSLLDLYHMLLHSPPVAAGWLRYLTAIRHECTLPGAIRELVIVRIAIVNGASYEAAQHVPIALKEGVLQDQIDALPFWEISDHFNDRERAVLAYCDAMTRDIRVPDPVADAVRAFLSDRHLVELTATIAAYNMVSRFLEALKIHAEDAPDEKGGH